MRSEALKPTHTMKPIEVFAHQWFGDGDHPEDGPGSEALVVRRFRRPEPQYAGDVIHKGCGRRWDEHGLLGTLAPETVCPGDWILLITTVDGLSRRVGDYWACKPDIFHAMYSPKEADETPGRPALRVVTGFGDDIEPVLPLREWEGPDGR